MPLARLLFLCSLGLVGAQQVGKVAKEEPPVVVVQRCVNGSGCVDEETFATLDANWRWTHDAEGYQNCFLEGEWTPTFCKDDRNMCASKCAVEGVDAQGYANSYGVKSIPGGLELQFVSGRGNVGSRLYLREGESYKMFKLKNREFTLDVDASALPCGLNGAVYFVAMDADGQKGIGDNEAGAVYGTGYCDAQCPHDIKWIEGEANLDWTYGTCCIEMDIWEANSMATAYTPHTCDMFGPYRCEGTDCGDTEKGERFVGVCDKDGCDMNVYRFGVKDFYGPGPEFAVDTTKPMTVVTQFLTADGTDEGDLVEIRRVYVQDGKVIQQANVSVPGFDGNSITDEFCKAQKAAFDDPDEFCAKGGLKKMGEALDRGMVLTLSLWDDEVTEMHWLDSHFPRDESISKPGVVRGPCDGEKSNPEYLRQAYAQATVKYTNIMHGEIGSTFSEGPRRLGSMFV